MIRLLQRRTDLRYSMGLWVLRRFPILLLFQFHVLVSPDRELPRSPRNARSRSPNLPADVNPYAGGVPTQGEVLGALTGAAWPQSHRRRNGLQEGVKHIEAMRLSISWDYNRQQACYSGASTARPALTSMLAAFSRTMPDHDFTFTGSQRNKGYHATVHADPPTLAFHGRLAWETMLVGNRGSWVRRAIRRWLSPGECEGIVHTMLVLPLWIAWLTYVARSLLLTAQYHAPLFISSAPAFDSGHHLKVRFQHVGVFLQ